MRGGASQPVAGGWVEDEWSSPEGPSDAPSASASGPSLSAASSKRRDPAPAWSLRSSLAAAAAAAVGASAGRSAPGPGRAGREQPEEGSVELDPWGQLLTEEPVPSRPRGPQSGSNAAGGEGEGERGGSLPQAGPGSGWVSLVQHLGQHWARASGGAGPGASAEQSQQKGWSLSWDAPASRGVGVGAPPPASAALRQPLLQPASPQSREEGVAGAASVSVGPSVSSVPQGPSGSGRPASSGWSLIFGAGLGAGSERGATSAGDQGEGARSSRSRDELVVPLRSSGSVQNGQGTGGGWEGGEEEEEELEAERTKEEMLRIGRPLRPHWGWGDMEDASLRHGCLHKAAEVLPVMGVVFALVLGTFLYFTIVDRVLAQFKAPFSLMCKVEAGSWTHRTSPSLTLSINPPATAASPGPALAPRKRHRSKAGSHGQAADIFAYPPSCPFIRDAFNCAKFGLPVLLDSYTWQPDACQLASITPASLLKLLSNRQVAFVGDMSMANQYDSFVCLLAQQEQPVVSGPGSDAHSTGAPDGSGAKPGGRGLREGLAAGRQGGGGLPVSEHEPLARIAAGRAEEPKAGQSWRRGMQEIAARLAGGTHGRGRVLGSAGAGDEAAPASGASSDDGFWRMWPFGGEGGAGVTRGAQHAGDQEPGPAAVPDAGGVEDAALQAAQDQNRMSRAHFPMHNVSVTFFHSPFLVQAQAHVSVNASACQLSKAALLALQTQHEQQQHPEPPAATPPPPSDPIYSNATGAGRAQPDSERPGPAEDILEQRQRAVLRACYPNEIDLAVPDPFWAEHVPGFDVVVLSSGRGWTEEVVERQGLRIVQGGLHQQDLSLEGLVGEWAFPHAMASVALWLNNSTNFPGTAVFRSFSPSHVHKECASRPILDASKAIFEREYEATFQRYNDAMESALRGTRHLFLNITSMSWERADGHPWMASPVRPKADCSNWCLPGVPDAWNHILASMLLAVFHERADL